MKVLVKKENQEMLVVETNKIEISYETVLVQDVIDSVLDNTDYGVGEFLEGYDIDYLLLLYLNECFGVETSYSDLGKVLEEARKNNYHLLYNLLKINFKIDSETFTTLSICHIHLAMPEIDKILSKITKEDVLVVDTTKTSIIDSRIIE